MARVALSGYQTKQNRRKLKNGIYTKSPLVYALKLEEEQDIALLSSDNRLLEFNTQLLKTKTTTNTQGVQVLLPKAGRHVLEVGNAQDFLRVAARKENYHVERIPAAGSPIRQQDEKTLFD